MDDFISNRYKRRVFFAGAFIACIALIAIRFFIVPYFSGQPPANLETILNSIVDNLLVALVASIAITLLALWLTSPSVEIAVMKVVEPIQIRETLQEALYHTNEWWYRGQTGRHFRSVTLPKLAEGARSEKVSRSVYLIILDPSDPEICRRYADYRNSLITARKDRSWTAQRVQLELNATIVSAYAWQAEQPLLDVTVALLTTVPLFRIDFSSRLALITREDPQEPALRCDEGTFFYKAYREDLRFSLQQSRQLPRTDKGIPISMLDANSLELLLVAVGLNSQNLDKADLQRIVSLVKRAENPYA